MSKNNKGSSQRAEARERQYKKEAKEEISDALLPLIEQNPNPIKRLIKINQFPWTQKQKDFFKMALDDDTRIVFVNGPAGTSKSLLSVYCGLQLLNKKVISDIMYLRSAVESSESKLGFLPGSAEDKLRFYNLPFLDKLDELLPTNRVSKLEQEGRVSMFPVNFARGMNWASKCIILDEAQNSTLKEITTVLTRMGNHSRCFILADPMQTDLNHGKEGAFEKMFKLFSDEESHYMGVKSFEFTEDDIMRSELVKFLVKKMKNIPKN